MKKLLIIIILLLIMSDFTELGYDQFLTRVDPTQPQMLNPLQSAAFTDDIMGENITTKIEGTLIGKGINASNITVGDMSFDRARGGTLQLGGYNNASGLFSLLDEQNLERISMSKDGMVITSGSLTVKDSRNQTVVDASGIVSTAAFKSGTLRSGSLSSTANSALAQTMINDLGFNISVTRATNVLVILSAVGQNDNGALGGQAFVGISINGQRVTTLCPIHGTVLNGVIQNVTTSVAVVTALQPGNNFIKAFFGRLGSGNALITSDSQISYIILGN